jgi:hypothetical protein
MSIYRNSRTFIKELDFTVRSIIMTNNTFYSMTNFLTWIKIMFFRRKNQDSIKEKIYKLSGREIDRSVYEIGLSMWDRAIRGRLEDKKEVVAVEKKEDATRDAIYYRLANEIDIFLGVELNKRIRKTTKTVQDISRAINQRYQKLVENHAEYEKSEHEEGITVNLIPSFKLKANQFTFRLKERIPKDARIIARLVEVGPESQGIELELLSHQREFIVGGNPLLVDYYASDLADEHFGISVQSLNFYVYHLPKSKDAFTEIIQNENTKLPVTSQYQLINHKDYIVAGFQDRVRRFQFFLVDTNVVVEDQPSSRYRLVETGYYILRSLDLARNIYHYPTVFFSDAESITGGVRDIQHVPLPGMKNVGSPAKIIIRDGEFYIQKLSTIAPISVKLNGQEIPEGAERKLPGIKDKLEIGYVQFFFEKLEKRTDTPLAVLEITVADKEKVRHFPLYGKPIIISGDAKRPGHDDYLFLNENSIPHNAIRLSFKNGVLFVEKGKAAPPLFVNGSETKGKHALSSGDVFNMEKVNIKVTRRDLPPAFCAKLTLTAESRRPVHLLPELSKNKVYTLGREAPDDSIEDPTRYQYFIKISNDLHVSASHARLSLTGERMATIQNISESNSIFIVSANGALRADLPQKSFALEVLMRWDRIIIGPIELEYRGPGSSMVISDSYEV